MIGITKSRVALHAALVLLPLCARAVLQREVYLSLTLMCHWSAARFLRMSCECDSAAGLCAVCECMKGTDMCLTG